MRGERPGGAAGALLLLLLAGCASEEKVDQQCTVIDEGDGTATITCPSGEVRVPLGNVDTACTMSQLPAGGSRIFCSNGVEIRLDERGNVIFPGGGSIAGQAYLLGEQGRAGIRITAGSYSTVTDRTGEFTLSALPAGIYQVAVHYPGYAAQVEINVPAVGGVWRIQEPIILYPGHAITPVNPSTLLLSPTQDTLLVQTIRTSGVGPLALHELDPQVADPSDYNPLSPDAREVDADGSYRADGGAVVWVEHLDPEGGTAVVRFVDRAPGEALPQRELVSAARFFGDQVLLVGTEAVPGVFLWDPESGEELQIHDANVGLSQLIVVWPGETLIVQELEEGFPFNFLWRRSEPGELAPFGVGSPQVAGGGAAAVTEEGALVGIYRDGPLLHFEPTNVPLVPEEVFIAPDGRTCISTQPGRLWNLAAGGVKTLAKPVSGVVVFTSDGASAQYVSDDVAYRADLRTARTYDLGITNVTRVVAGNGGELVYENPAGLWYWAPGDPVPAAPAIAGPLSSWAYEPVFRRAVYIKKEASELWYQQLGKPRAEPVLVDELGTDAFLVGELGIVYRRAERKEDDVVVEQPVIRTWSFDPEAGPTQIGEASSFEISDDNPRFLPGGAGFYGMWDQGTFFCDMRTGRQRFYKVEDTQATVHAVAPDRLIYELSAGGPGARNGIFVMYVR